MLTAQTVQVLVVNDSLLESDEVLTASLSLENPADLGYIELRPISASVTITDDDGNEHAGINFILIHSLIIIS